MDQPARPSGVHRALNLAMNSPLRTTVTAAWKNRLALLLVLCLALVGNVALQLVSPHVVYGGAGLVAGVLVWAASPRLRPRF